MIPAPQEEPCPFVAHPSLMVNTSILGMGGIRAIYGLRLPIFPDPEVIIRQNEGIFSLFLALFTPVGGRSYLATFGGPIGSENGFEFVAGCVRDRRGVMIVLEESRVLRRRMKELPDNSTLIPSSRQSIP
jgi:hypothetical protein